MLKNHRVIMPVLYIVNVKHGNSAVLVDRDGVVVFDTGRRTELIEFLISKRINQIDLILLSHADADHIGGAMALINSQEFLVGAVYINSDIKDTKIFDDLIWSISNNKNIKLEPSITPNLNGQLNQGDVDVEVLAPNTYLATKAAGGKDRRGRSITSNTISAVIRLKYKGNNIVLLPGDIDKIGLESLLEEKKNIESKIVIFPHHGGTPGGSEKIDQFVEKICELTSADFIVFSIGDNDTEYPRKEVVNCITSKFKNIKILSTGSSKILEDYIQKNSDCSHKSGIGNIEFDFDSYPLIYKSVK